MSTVYNYNTYTYNYYLASPELSEVHKFGLHAFVAFHNRDYINVFSSCELSFISCVLIR